MADFIFLVFKDIVFAFFVAVGFALLFETPKRVVYVAGALGGIGHCIRFILLHFDFGLVSSTLAGCIFIGIAGIYCAHKVHTPPVVFTMPACITMIPGLYAYRTMMGWIRIYTDGLSTQEPYILQETAYYFILTSSLLFSLAIGICVGALFFRKKSAKEIKLGKRL